MLRKSRLRQINCFLIKKVYPKAKSILKSESAVETSTCYCQEPYTLVIDESTLFWATKQPKKRNFCRPNENHVPAYQNQIDLPGCLFCFQQRSFVQQQRIHGRKLDTKYSKYHYFIFIDTISRKKENFIFIVQLNTADQSQC